ncbi:hypothetical protein AKO1_010468 [Acrasis kona]|uniref:Gamma-interferon-inducible lysosomal thiol reductase n=1 Tax=Acrasis kona TaxID=1008807 RepID=A0AAW2ZJ74_9EUKA
MLKIVCLLLALTVICTAQNITVSLYYESHCPGCQSLIISDLTRLQNADGVKEIVNLRLIPYGNAREKEQGGKYVFTCQHGEKECEGNAIEQCLITTYGNTWSAFAEIVCLEKQFRSGAEGSRALSSCVQNKELLNKVKSCVTGDKINSIMHENAQETAQLQPPHKYVPWLVIDGQHIEDYGDDLLGYVCARYKGTKPAGCRRSNRANVCLNE